MFKYAIIGFGGLGKIHLANLNKIEKERGDIKLAAICGTTREDAKKSTMTNIGAADLSGIDFSDCNFYDDYKEMIDKENLDFIFAVLPTYLHEEVAVYILEKGIHLFSEKPMALSVDGCERMVAAKKASGKQLMIGQCMRFHPAYLKLKKWIAEGKYGKVRRAEFNRFSQLPTWTWNNWILDDTKSGGCIIDMHIHDVDLINWYFGVPNSLQSAMTSKKVKKESVSTHYFYDDFLVISQADWALPHKFPFTERCRIDFDEATVVIENEDVTIYTEDEVIKPEREEDKGFYEEDKAFISLIADGIPCEITSAESVCESMKIAMKELESAEKGERVYLK